MPNGMIGRDHPALSLRAHCRLLSISRASFHHEPSRETEMSLTLVQLFGRPLLETPFSGVRQMTRHLRKPQGPWPLWAAQARGRLPRREPEAHPAAHAADADPAGKPDTGEPGKGQKTCPCPARAGCAWTARGGAASCIPIAIMDRFTRKVLAWRISDRRELALEDLQLALAEVNDLVPAAEEGPDTEAQVPEPAELLISTQK